MQFQINNKKYNLKDDWFQITLSDAVKLTQTEDETEKLAILSNCPLKVLQKTDKLHLQILYEYIEDYINAIYKIDIENYPVIGLTEYKHKGVKYYMPKGTEINGTYIPMTHEPAYNIIEAQEVLKHIHELEKNGIEAMNLFCAIYLKEKHGVISDTDVARRAIAFQDLPMFVIWEVFFYMHYSLVSFLIDTRFSSGKKAKQAKILGYIISHKQELQAN